MKKIILLITILVFPFWLNGQEPGAPEPSAPAGIPDMPVSILQLWPGYPKGLNTRQASHLIADDEVQDCSNVLFDKERGPVCRDGYKRVNDSVLSTATVRFMHEYPKINGNKYLIVLSSNILAYSANTISYTTLLSTVPTNAKMWAVNYNDWCYLGFNNWNRWKFDGSTLYSSTTTPQIKYAIVYKDKIIGVNVNETGGKSKLVYSDVGYPDVWPSLNYIYIDRDDEITGIKVYSGNLYVFKKNSKFIMLGLEDGYPTNDGYYKIDNIGCLYNETIKEKDNLLYFVSPRGVEEFNSVNTKPVSERIEPDIKNLSQMHTGTLIWNETTANDFADGTFFGVSTITVPGSITWEGILYSSTVVVDSNGSTGYYPSIKINGNNRPCISYYDNTNPYVIKYASWTGTNWAISTIGTNDKIGNYAPSLAIDSLNVPHISYQWETGLSTQYLKYSSYTATGWKTSTIDSAGSNGAYNSIAVDSNNNPHISCSGANGILKYSSYTIAGGWGTSTADSNNGSSAGSSIIIDGNNKPHISHYDTVSDDLKYSSFTGTVWLNYTIDSTGDVGSYNSIAFGTDSNIHISYYDATNGNLKYSTYTVTGGWGISTIDSTGDVGKYTSLKLDSNNKPRISYYDATNYDLKYASWTGTAWSTSTLDSTGDVGQFTSLALDSWNEPHISYWVAVSSDLKYYSTYSTSTLPSYTSSKFNATTAVYNWLGWQKFQATENLPSDVTMKYYTKTATSKSGLDTASWQQINNNNFSKSNDGSWIQYKFEFISTQENTTARIDDVSIDYSVDSQNKPLIATVWDRRYLLAGAIKPEINNNIIYVLDQNNNWTKFNNMYVGTFANFKDGQYFSSSTDTFQINKYSDDYTDDNGTSLSPFIKTKDYSFDTFINDKYFADLWVYAEPSIVFSSMTVSFYLNKLTAAASTKYISLIADSTYPDKPIISKTRNPADRFRYINFRISNFNKLYGLFFKYGIHSEGEK